VITILVVYILVRNYMATIWKHSIRK